MNKGFDIQHAREVMGIPEPKGQTYDQQRDGERLAGQYQRVCEFMADGQWRSLAEIAAAVAAPEASVSARLRDMRRGGYIVDRMHIVNGLHKYRARRERP